MKSGSWVSAPAMLSEHGAARLRRRRFRGHDGWRDERRGGGDRHRRKADGHPIHAGRYTLLRSVRINVTW